MLKRVITFTSWLLGVYILLFTTSFYVHINETRIITNKANSLLHKLTDIDFSGLRKVSKTQNRKRKTKPVFFKPPTLYNSLFGEREFVNSANQLLRNRIEKLKRNLDNIAFSNAHFEGINLSNASMFNADLKSAKLKNADLSDANLIYADLQNTDFHSANLNRTNFYKSHFNNTFLQGANLSGAKNITCAQITLAMINESTHLPDYIRLEGSQCIHLREGKGWDLSNMNLAYGDFSNENFANANLNQANLKGANLSTTTNITCDQISSAIIDKNTQLPDYLYVTLPPQSVFKCLNLVKGNGVDLKAADLGRIFLAQANFRGADLSQANLENSHLYAANLADANLHQTNLKGANLSTTTNITCDQVMSAIIDKNTQLPDYLYVTLPPQSVFKCIHLIEGKGANLKNANLQKIYLHRPDLQNADLSQANLENSHLLAANLADANLNQANLKGANLSTTTNITCDQVMSAIIDKNTQLPDYLYVTLPPQSVFKCIHLIEGKGANLKNANLQEIYLHRSNLQSANLSQANLENSHLYATNLADANLNQANLKGANLSTTKNITCDQVMSAIIDKNTQLPDYLYVTLPPQSVFKCIHLIEGKGANLKNANLQKIYLHRPDLQNADLSQANLENSHLYAANLADANLHQTNLKGANLSTTTNITCDQVMSAIIDKNTQLPDYLYVTLPPQSVFKCIHLIEGKGANLKNANLQKIYLHRPDLQNADLSQANLENSHLLAANLANANLNQANLKGANLSTTKNITCDQVMSAIIDRYTRLPDYIHLIESSPSAQKCRKIVKKKK